MKNDMAALTELSLFSGAGGGLLGTKYLLGWRNLCYVEWDKYAVEVLKARIRD
jgi:site-specific DNA-cytosine methylase